MKTILRNLFFPVVRLRFLKDSYVFYSTSTTYQEKKIQVGKYNINYLKVGHGPHNVLCMPGALGSIWTDFQPQIEGFDREKFCLIVWDAPGYGKSRPPEREFHDDYYAQDVDIALEFMKAINVRKFSVMGWSYGGATSMILAGKHPDVVQKVVVWGTCTFFLPHEIDTFKSSKRACRSQKWPLPPMEKCNQLRCGMHREMRDIRSWPEKNRKPMIELYGEQRFSELWPCVVDAMDRLNNNKTNITHYLEGVTCPMFILHGEKDYLIDKSHVYYMASIQGSRIHIYPEGTHSIHKQYPDDFNQRVQEFLLE